MKVLVTGGGISGLFLSYYLLKDGHEVVLANAARGSVRTSAYNAGQLSARPSFTDIFSPSALFSKAEMRREWRWFELARRQSRERYEKVAAPLSVRSLALYDEFFSRERPEVDLAEEVLELHSTPRGEEEPAPEGRLLRPRELSELGYKGFEEGWLMKERSLHSRKLLDFLGSRVPEMGGKVVDGNVRLKSADSQISRAVVGGEHLVADAYVVAGGSWSREICRPLGYDPMVIPARGLVLFYRTGGKRAVDFPSDYEDEGLTVTQHDNDTLRLTSYFELVGYNPRFGRARMDWLFETAVSHFSREHSMRLTEAGVGFRPSTPDQLPVVGRMPRCENGYVLTGSCRKGMALAPVLSRLLMGRVLGSTEPDEPLLRALDPGRFERDRRVPKF